jgi:NAD(P)-dependent dehydrogenase (short-subunit alcohol dehydrogenase family)
MSKEVQFREAQSAKVSPAQTTEETRRSSACETVDPAIVDVTDAEAVSSATASTAEKFGRIDILVVNAGITGPNFTCWEYPESAWKQVIDVDLTGVFLCCRAIIPSMLRQNYGRIINVSSIAGKEGNPNTSAYSAAKAGVMALTKSLGKEVA